MADQNPLEQMLQQVQKMQSDMTAAQDALHAESVEGSAGGGAVRVVCNGAGEVQSVHIASEAVDPDDVEMLEDLVLAAFGDAQRRSRELQAQRLGSVTGGIDLGGLGGLLG